MILNKIQLRGDPRWYAALGSLLLSLWIIHQNGIINGDGILYLHAARAFLDQGWRAAADIYPWPFFSGLVALLQHVSGLSLENSAYVINSLLYALLVVVFVTLVGELHASRRIHFYAALLVLLLPSLNGYRDYIIRDVGYWAFYLIGLLYFLRYLRGPRLSHALAWGLSMLVATLFRIEGLAFLCVLPLFLLLQFEHGWRTRLLRLLQMNIVLIVSAAMLALFFALGEINFMGRLGDPILLLQKFAHSATTGIEQKAEALRIAVLGRYAKDFAFPSVIMIQIMILTSYVLSGFGLAHLILSVRGILRAKLSASCRPALLFLLWAALLQILILVVFVVGQFFLTGRFVIALVLTCLVFAALGLEAFREDWKETGAAKRSWHRKWAYPLLCFLLFVAAIGSLHSFGPSKTYLKDAGEWIQENVPRSSRLLTNNDAVAFYSELDFSRDSRQFDDDRVEAQLKKSDYDSHYDYVALNVDRRYFRRERKILEGEPIARFRNNRGDELLIFKTRKASLGGEGAKAVKKQSGE